MFKYKIEFSALFLGVMLSYSTQVLGSSQLNGAKFLTYSDSGQQSYITIAAGMAGVIAGQNNKTQASCIDKWISKNRANRYSTVIAAMKNNTGYHPHAVILAVIQKACGSFRYK